VPQVSISSPFTATGTLEDARLGERQTWIEGEQPRTAALRPHQIAARRRTRRRACAALHQYPLPWL
jgi:hypothetical protein